MNEKITWYFKDKESLGYLDFKDKDSLTRLQIETMLQRTNSMFKWNGLPETIPEDILESMLQQNGYAGIIKQQGKLFAVIGGVGGIRNYNYQPTHLIVSNPYLLLESKAFKVYYGEEAKIQAPLVDNLKIFGDCVIIQNDNLNNGIIPLCRYYASQLTENVISKRLVTILSRAIYIFAASDNDVAQDFKDLISNITDGELDCILAEGILADGAVNSIQTLPLAKDGHQALTNLIEDQQYIKASWFNDLGLQANYNMKRESLNSNESQLNKDIILPFVDNMYQMRKLACKRINELFGVNWSVEYNSAWLNNRLATEQAIDAIDKTTDMNITKDEETTQVVEDEVTTQVVEDEGGNDE